MRASKYTVSAQAMLEAFCCLSFAGVLVYLLITNGYQRYVTPKMVPYFYFTVAVMVVWAAAGLVRRKTRTRVRAAHCFTLALPILLLLLPHAQVTSASLSSGFLGGNAATASAASPVVDAGQSQQIAGQAEPAYGTELSGLDKKTKTITVSDSEYYLWISKLYENPGKYEGYKINMTGFVFRDSSQMKDNEFVPARLMMTCCVSDLTPVGMLCQYDNVAQLSADSWVTIQGQIHYEEFEGIQDPQITVTGVTPAQEVPGYLYPV